MRTFLYFFATALAAAVFGALLVVINGYMWVIIDVFPRWQLITIMMCAGLLGMWGLISWIVHEEQKWDQHRRFFRD